MTPRAPADAVVREATLTLSSGGIIAFPTDTLYGIGCDFGRPAAADRIARLRGIDSARRPLTFLLPDLGELPHWALVGPTAYRILDRVLPGPYCFELLASARVPNPFVNQQRRTIGVRVPADPFCRELLWSLGRPILTVTAKSRAGAVLSTAAELQDEYGEALDLIIDGGTLAGAPSTVISLVDDWVTVLREGRGPSGPALLA